MRVNAPVSLFPLVSLVAMNAARNRRHCPAFLAFPARLARRYERNERYSTDPLGLPSINVLHHNSTQTTAKIV